MEAASVAAYAGRRAAKLAKAHDLAADVVRDAEATAREAAAIRIEAQARAGELLKQMAERGERANRAGGGPKAESCGATQLRDLGVSKSESSLWQQVASVPPEVRAEYVEEAEAPVLDALHRAAPTWVSILPGPASASWPASWSRPRRRGRRRGTAPGVAAVRTPAPCECPSDAAHPLVPRRARAARPAGAGRRRRGQPPPAPRPDRLGKGRGLFLRVDRATPWGNLFVIGRDGDRATVIARYRDDHLPVRPDLLARLDELRGKALGCRCAPLACHADVLAAAVAEATSGAPADPRPEQPLGRRQRLPKA
jgi:Domain of unknown function (DUF4326)